MLKSVFLAAFIAVAVAETLCPGGDCDKAEKPESCGSHSKCASCVADLHCGWCASESSCMKGNVMGPAKVNCSTWDYAFCSGEPCSSYSECDACTADPLCGWCATTGVCTEGSADRPVFIQCLARDWRYGAGTCAKCQCPDVNGKCPEKAVEGESGPVKCAAPNKAFTKTKKNQDLNSDPDAAAPADEAVAEAKTSP